MTQYQNPVINENSKSLNFVIGHSPCDTISGLKSLDANIILMKAGLFLLIQVFNQEMRKPQEFETGQTVDYL